MKLNVALNQIGVEADYEKQVNILRYIKERGFYEYWWYDDRGYQNLAVVLPYSDKYAQMIEELTHIEKFLDILEFAYVEGVAHIYG